MSNPSAAGPAPDPQKPYDRVGCTVHPCDRPDICQPADDCRRVPRQGTAIPIEDQVPPQAEIDVRDALDEALRVTKPLREKELEGERIPSGFKEIRLDAKGMDQQETFNWLVERSNRLEQAEAALTALRAERDDLQTKLTEAFDSEVTSYHEAVNRIRSLEAALAESRKKYDSRHIERLEAELSEASPYLKAGETLVACIERQDLDAVLTLLAEARARLAVPAWQDVATAPHLTEVLVQAGKARYLAYLTDQEPPMVNTWRHTNGEQLPIWPTHWMPLPPPPAAEGEKV